MKVNLHNRHKQEGMTLLLSVLIMSGLTLIAITISALAIQSIRTSRAVVFSEPAIGAAHSGAEEGIWSIKRAVSLPACDSNNPRKNSESLGSTSLYAGRAYCISYQAATFVLDGNTPFVFYLYDPDGPNSDLDLSGMIGGGYQVLTVSNQGSRNVNTTVTRLDGSAVGSPPSPVTISPGNSRDITNLAGPQTGDPTANDNRMKVTLSCPTCGSNDLTTVVVNTDLGMPTYPTVDSEGCAQRGTAGQSTNECSAGEVYTRRVNVTVPQ